MKTMAYLRVSKSEQEVKNQRLAILDFAQEQDIRVDEFFEINISSRKGTRERGIDSVLGQLHSGDHLIVSELSRLGRSVGQIIQIVDQLVKKKIQFTAIKEKIKINGKRDMQTKVMITMFGLFAEIERDLISVRTKEGLAAARAKGKLLGRPRGTFKSRLDGKENEIKTLLDKGVSKSSIAKIMDVSRTTLVSFVKSRKL